ncbi:MAG TPA: IS1595 family transposase [Phycisphaerae bacterium]|nr:IS1595 family transposase [Phycisphaerae bacterium]
MSKKGNTPSTLFEAVEYFKDEDMARAFFADIRWPDGVVRCPHCGSDSVHWLVKQKRWQCRGKHKRLQFSVKVGTVFEESPIPLGKWLVAVWLEINAKNSISSFELARALGTTQKTAWFVLHRVRLALSGGTFEKMSGEIESDATYIGGLGVNMHAAKRKAKIKGKTGMSDKTAVLGVLERSGEDKASRIAAKVLPVVRRSDLHGMIDEHVEPGSHIYTDAWVAYRRMNPKFNHEYIDHEQGYVRDKTHTNGLENFWSLFKRCVKGTHVSIMPFHLQAYVDSEAFRFNHRKLNDGQRFMEAMRGTIGKRLMYQELKSRADTFGVID